MKNFTKLFPVLFTVSTILFSISTKAQSYQVGTSVINLGVGFGNSYSYYGAGGSSTPVISGSYEYGVTKLGPGILGLGAQIAYQGASYSYSAYDNYYYYYYGGPNTLYTYNYTWTTILFGVRGTYYPDFCNGKKYNVYGALQLSYVHAGFSYTTNDPYTGYGAAGASASSFYPYLMIGGRYFFTNNIGIFAELGYDLAYLNFGLSIKFGGSGGGTSSSGGSKK